MLKWLKKLFFRDPEPEEPDDPEWSRNRDRVIMEAFRTGKPILGTYDEKGNFVMTVIGEEKDQS